MSIGIFCDSARQPKANEVFGALGARRPLWEELTTFLADNYPIPGEWNFGGKNYGWNVRYRKSGKTLVTLFPQEESLVVQLVLGKDQAEQALQLRLGKHVRKVLAETPQLHDGRWLFIRARTHKDIQDIERLIQIKRRPKPQQGA